MLVRYTSLTVCVKWSLSSASACMQFMAWWRHQMETFSVFPRNFVRGIHWSPVNSPHKGQWRGALMLSLICSVNKRLNKQSWGWCLRRHGAHYDVIVLGPCVISCPISLLLHFVVVINTKVWLISHSCKETLLCTIIFIWLCVLITLGIFCLCLYIWTSSVFVFFIYYLSNNILVEDGKLYLNIQ